MFKWRYFSSIVVRTIISLSSLCSDPFPKLFSSTSHYAETEKKTIFYCIFNCFTSLYILLSKSSVSVVYSAFLNFGRKCLNPCTRCFFNNMIFDVFFSLAEKNVWKDNRGKKYSDAGLFSIFSSKINLKFQNLNNFLFKSSLHFITLLVIFNLIWFYGTFNAVLYFEKLFFLKLKLFQWRSLAFIYLILFFLNNEMYVNLPY